MDFTTNYILRIKKEFHGKFTQEISTIKSVIVGRDAHIPPRFFAILYNGGMWAARPTINVKIIFVALKVFSYKEILTV